MGKDDLHEGWKGCEELEVAPAPVDTQEVAEHVGADNHAVIHHPLEVLVQRLNTWLTGKVEPKVEKMGAQKVVKLDKVLPGSVDKALPGHVSLSIKAELNSETLFPSIVWRVNSNQS